MKRPIPAAASERIATDLAIARSEMINQDTEAAWHALEEAHILSQPWAWHHVKVHGVMLQLAWRTRDRREITGQLLRMAVAGPGSLVGRYPSGNTGRATVPINRPMPISAELAAMLGDAP